ncbi:transcriptional regulator, AsnC family [Oscillibacter sp. PC13]|jgi:Lrp/AsnC family leucine-responsive transcriptional regulator|uniref:Lrp/AsnC family transcriptional regulator n=1 Tax=Oscillibacter sp. PC13 TaxID=1855299 RepID=UPI0008EDB744|nr:Lrp/AsnC family transcriptional regulator [Oscillibacter sp. PC13]SFP27427.1 transcriptional regulator, AsnC family [Oscillibacter sp. PC13]
MYLSGLDELDQKILQLLIENARYSYSEIGERVGVSRVAAKAHINLLEERGIIEKYTAVINPQQLGGAVSCYFEIETTPETFAEVTEQLYNCPTVTQIYRMTGKCRLHVHAVAAGQAELEQFMAETMDRLPGVTSVNTNVILSRIKDIKGLRL